MLRLISFFVFILFGMSSIASAHADRNPFAYQHCVLVPTTAPELSCYLVKKGDSWQSVFPDAAERLRVQMYNRQNQKELHDGQWLVVPRADVQWQLLAPLPQQLSEAPAQLVVFDPVQLAWGHYDNGQLVRWGPAIGGKPWCRDIKEPCYTDVGTFQFSEAAGPDRRSSVYPKKRIKGVLRNCNYNNPNRRGCAPMPFFTRFTAAGQGLHERTMNGAHASHGCVGMFRDDVVYVSELVRQTVGSRSYGHFSPEQIERSPVFVVWPYAAPQPNS